MKKLIFLLAAILAVSVCGTAIADTAVGLDDSTATLRAYRGPVVVSDSEGTGTTAYIATGPVPYLSAQTPGTNAGVSIFAIDTNRTDATGNLVKKELTAGAGMRAKFHSGTTLVGAPVVSDNWAAGTGSRTGVSVFVLIANSQERTVGNFAGNSTANAGLSLFALNGASGATVWERGIALNGMGTGSGGTSSFFSSPITIDTESASSSGVTLYGVAGGGPGPNAVGGASIYSVDGDTGALVGVSQFSTGTPTSGASAFSAAPVISGNSLYVIGANFITTGGVTLFALNKNNINAGVSLSQTVIPTAVDFSRSQLPTPAVSGNSLYVVAAGAGTWAGVTVYDKNTLAVQYTRQIGPIAATGGVSASPVTDGNFIVLSTLTAVTCYPLNSSAGLSNNTRKWTIDLATAFTDGTYQMWGTPAISNGYVYIPVTDTTGADKGFVLRCTLDSATGSALKIGNITKMVAADPIVSGSAVWASTLNPTVTKITDNTGARGEVNWLQFKADPAKTGANTRTENVPVPVGDDDSGCFISTIK